MPTSVASFLIPFTWKNSLPKLPWTSHNSDTIVLMPKKFSHVYLVAIVGAVILLLVAYLSTHNVQIFNPKGTIAHQERNLILTAFALMAVVLVPLLITAYIFAWKYRAGNKHSKYDPDENYKLKGGLLWAVIPFLVCCGLAVIIWKGAHNLDPYKPLQSSVKPITIKVVALDWKWLFIYPDQNIATVNFIQFPAQTPVNFELTADAPMNSFWIPQLSGQIYAMPGMVTQLHIMADGPGEYSGQAAEINGDGYSGMRFVARSSSQADFNNWVNEVKQLPTALDWKTYNTLAQPSQNNPQAFYSSVDSDLYNKIIMKYMAPTNPNQNVEQMIPGMHM